MPRFVFRRLAAVSVRPTAPATAGSPHTGEPGRRETTPATAVVALARFLRRKKKTLCFAAIVPVGITSFIVPEGTTNAQHSQQKVFLMIFFNISCSPAAVFAQILDFRAAGRFAFASIGAVVAIARLKLTAPIVGHHLRPFGKADTFIRIGSLDPVARTRGVASTNSFAPFSECAQLLSGLMVCTAICPRREKPTVVT